MQAPDLAPASGYAESQLSAWLTHLLLLYFCCRHKANSSNATPVCQYTVRHCFKFSYWPRPMSLNCCVLRIHCSFPVHYCGAQLLHRAWQHCCVRLAQVSAVLPSAPSCQLQGMSGCPLRASSRARERGPVELSWLSVCPNQPHSDNACGQKSRIYLLDHLHSRAF